MKIRHEPIRPADKAVSLEAVVRALIGALEEARIQLPPIARRLAQESAADKKTDNNRA